MLARACWATSTTVGCSLREPSRGLRNRQAADFGLHRGRLAHMSFSMSASLIFDCSSLRQEERAVVPVEWAGSLAASTALPRMETSCRAQAAPVSEPGFGRRRGGCHLKHTFKLAGRSPGASCADRELWSDREQRRWTRAALQRLDGREAGRTWPAATAALDLASACGA